MQNQVVRTVRFLKGSVYPVNPERETTMAIKFYSTSEETYGCFSNFSRHPVQIDGTTWPTTEHYYQAMKFPNDAERRELSLIHI